MSEFAVLELISVGVIGLGVVILFAIQARFVRVVGSGSATGRLETFADALVRIEELLDFGDECGIALARFA